MNYKFSVVRPGREDAPLDIVCPVAALESYLLRLPRAAAEQRNLWELFSQLRNHHLWLLAEHATGDCELYTVRRWIRSHCTQYCLAKFARHHATARMPEYLPAPSTCYPLDLLPPIDAQIAVAESAEPGGSSRRLLTRRLPKTLGGLLRTLLEEAGFCAWPPKSELRATLKFQQLRKAAEAYTLSEGIPASDFFVFARRRATVEGLGTRLSEAKPGWGPNSRPYALVLCLVESVRGNRVRIRTPAGITEEWTVHGQLVRPGWSGTPGPFLGLFAYGERADSRGEFGLVGGFLQPVVSDDVWLPVDFGLERSVFCVLAAFCAELRTAGFEAHVTRPTRPLHNGCMPDFLLHRSNLVPLAIENLGSSKPPYLQNKRRQSEVLLHDGMGYHGVCGYLKFTSKTAWRDELARLMACLQMLLKTDGGRILGRRNDVLG